MEPVPVSAGNQFHVSVSGSDAQSGTASSPWRTIAKAVAAGSPVGPGDIIISEPNTTSGGFGLGLIHAKKVSYWVISGFKLHNARWAGLSMQAAHHMVVFGCSTYQSGASGIIAMPADFFSGGESEVQNSHIRVLNNVVERAN